MSCRRYQLRVLRRGPRPRGGGRRASTTLPTQRYVTAASRPLQYLTTARNNPELQQSGRPDLASRVPAAAERTSCSAAARRRGRRGQPAAARRRALVVACCTAASVKRASLCVQELKGTSPLSREWTDGQGSNTPVASERPVTHHTRRKAADSVPL